MPSERRWRATAERRWRWRDGKRTVLSAPGNARLRADAREVCSVGVHVRVVCLERTAPTALPGYNMCIGGPNTPGGPTWYLISATGSPQRKRVRHKGRGPALRTGAGGRGGGLGASTRAAHALRREPLQEGRAGGRRVGAAARLPADLGGWVRLSWRACCKAGGAADELGTWAASEQVRVTAWWPRAASGSKVGPATHARRAALARWALLETATPASGCNGRSGGARGGAQEAQASRRGCWRGTEAGVLAGQGAV